MKKSGLICAATLEELQTFGLEDAETIEEGKLWRIPEELGEGYAAVTGAGIPLTLLRIIPLIQSLQPTVIFNIGIAGAYPDSDLQIGDVAVGTSEVFADLGMEMPDEKVFLPLSSFPFSHAVFRSPMPLWIPEGIDPTVKRKVGATVNRCTGKDGTGWLRKKMFAADFESMEGAAVALAAHETKIPVCEIRAISNFAADRDMQPANIQTALRSLSEFWKRHRSRLS